MAEWSKALRSGRSPKGREFEPHFCHEFFPGSFVARLLPKTSRPAGFEPARAKPNSLAGCRGNHFAKAALDLTCRCKVGISFGKSFGLVETGDARM